MAIPLLSLIPNAISKVAGVFMPNKEAQSQRDADARAASMGQYAAEFNVHTKRTWFDSFVDGANRLVRPIMAYSVLLFFGIVIYDVDLGLRVVQSLAVVPEGMWVLLSIIVTFYFGSRHILKGKQFEFDKKKLEAAKAIADTRKDMSDDVSADEYIRVMNDDSKPLSNAVVMEWNRLQKEKRG